MSEPLYLNYQFIKSVIDIIFVFFPIQDKE